MATQWFYKLMSDELGPCSAAELKEQATLGNIKDDTLVRKGTHGQWVAAWRVKGLIDSDAGDVTTSVGPPPLPANLFVDNAELEGPTDGQAHEDYGMPNYGKYARYTRTRNWNAICHLNELGPDSFGTKKELRVLPDYLESDDVVFALASGIMKQTGTSNAMDWGANTWLVVLTSERFLFLDHAMMTSSVDTQSIRHDRVQAVSASQGWVLGKIIIDLGARTVVVDNCNKDAVSVMASLANKWLAALAKKKERESAVSGTQGSSSPIDELKKLAELHSMGALTDDEFAAAKAKLLSSM